MIEAADRGNRDVRRQSTDHLPLIWVLHLELLGSQKNGQINKLILSQHSAFP